MSFATGMLPKPWNQLGWGVVSSAALLLLTIAMVRRERRTPGDVGVGIGARSVPRFLVGFIIGIATYALDVAGIAVFVGGLRVVPVASIDWSGAVLTLVTLFALSCMEELGFRGYPLRTLAPAIGAWAAQALVVVVVAAMLLTLSASEFDRRDRGDHKSALVPSSPPSRDLAILGEVAPLDGGRYTAALAAA